VAVDSQGSQVHKLDPGMKLWLCWVIWP